MLWRDCILLGLGAWEGITVIREWMDGVSSGGMLVDYGQGWM